MRVKSPRSLFGVVCLSSAVGLILYWVMFMNVLPRLMRPVASTVLPLMSGVIGAASCALLYLGVSSLMESARSKGGAKGALVLRRDRSGRVFSIGWAEAGYTVRAKSPAAGKARIVERRGQVKERGKAGYVGLWVLAALALVGYASSMALAGYTLQDVARGVYSPFMVISSGSMKPTINYGDLIILRKEPPERIAVGDIIAFNTPSPYDRIASSPIVHRVVEKLDENGRLFFKTRGDGNWGDDPWLVPAENVIGVYAGKIPYLGYPVLLLRSPYGLALVVILATLPLAKPVAKRLRR